MFSEKVIKNGVKPDKSIFLGLFTAFLVLMLFGPVNASAEWAVVVNSDDRTISTIDLSTTPPQVHGPFLAGQLGNDGLLLDIEVTPDGQHALVGNFHMQKLYLINLSNPLNPVVENSVNVTFYVEDIAVTHDGKYALVTDGGDVNKMAVVNLSTFALEIVYNLTTGYAQAVTVAPDYTVIIVDGTGDQIIYGLLDPSSGLVSETNVSVGDSPVNVVVAPDGQTVLVLNTGVTTGNSSISVFKIVSPGNLVPGSPPVISVPFGPQSVDFSPDGTKAYFVAPSNGSDTLSWLQINSPGSVAIGGLDVSTLLSDIIVFQWWGVDTLRVTSDGNYALVTNQGQLGSLTKNVSMVNLNTWTVSSIGVNSLYPVGIDVFTPGGVGKPPTSIPEFGQILVPVLTILGVVFLARFRRGT